MGIFSKPFSARKTNHESPGDCMTVYNGKNTWKQSDKFRDLKVCMVKGCISLISRDLIMCGKHWGSLKTETRIAYLRSQGCAVERERAVYRAIKEVGSEKYE